MPIFSLFFNFGVVKGVFHGAISGMGARWNLLDGPGKARHLLAQRGDVLLQRLHEILVHHFTHLFVVVEG